MAAIVAARVMSLPPQLVCEAGYHRDAAVAVPKNLRLRGEASQCEPPLWPEIVTGSGDGAPVLFRQAGKFTGDLRRNKRPLETWLSDRRWPVLPGRRRRHHSARSFPVSSVPEGSIRRNVEQGDRRAEGVCRGYTVSLWGM